MRFKGAWHLILEEVWSHRVPISESKVVCVLVIHREVSKLWFWHDVGFHRHVNIVSWHVSQTSTERPVVSEQLQGINLFEPPFLNKGVLTLIRIFLRTGLLELLRFNDSFWPS